MDRISVIIPGRCEQYFQQTIDSVLENATSDIEVIPIVDGYKPDPSLKINDERVKPIFLDKSIGQRAAYNLGVRKSIGKYVMKLDAHALLSPGFDETMKSHCPPKTIVLPEMRRLDVRKWEVKPRGRTHFMYFGLDVYCHFWSDYRKRDAAKIEYPEVLTGQGSCWFTTREWNDYIGLLDEGVGSWGKVGIEVSLRTWLCGGQQIVNKNAWQAHWFRRDDGGFTYPMDGRQVGRARDYTYNNYFFKEDAFKNQIRSFKWLLEKFAPVPSWEVYMADEYKANRIIVYYTDSKLEGSLARAVRSRLKKVAGPIPIISVSQKPLDFGQNICVGPKTKCLQSMYEQILVGVEAAPPESVIYLCEHDVFYHFSHFVRIPKTRNAMWFNINRYYWRAGYDSFLPARGKRAFSHGVAYREFIIEHIQDRIELWKTEPDNTLKIRWFEWKSERPNVDIRHGDNLTNDGHFKGSYLRHKKKGIKNLPGWGGPKHFSSIVSYKGVTRTDIIQFLMKQYNYQSYLEIGVDSGQNFKHVDCPIKDGVDPAGRCNYVMTSDEFFATTDKTYDLIFIDGLHLEKQVKRDIENSLKRLNPGGVIVMHDCNPITKEEQQVPRGKQKIWCGDVWKAFVKYRSRSDLEMYVVDTNNGVGIVRSGKQDPLIVENLSYWELQKNRRRWLNLKTIEEFRRYERNRTNASRIL